MDVDAPNDRDAEPEGGSRDVLTWLARTGRTAAHVGAWLDDPPPSLPPHLGWDRIEGMLLGLAIGDALGNRAEGMTPASRRGTHGTIREYLTHHRADGRSVGLPSDDSQMAFWTLEQLLADGRLVPDRLAVRFSREHIYGIGNTVRGFLRAFDGGKRPWYECTQPSAGNGALMRITPVLVPYVRAPSPDLWADAAVAGLITHNDAASIGACVGYVRALWGALALAGPPPPGWWVESVCGVMGMIEDETRYGPRVPHLSYEGPMWRFVSEQVGGALADDLPADEACNRWYSGAYLMETLPSVLYILERHAGDPEEAIVRAVNDTVDNDTIGAIVGAVVGALHGRRRLPQRWIEGLLGRTGAADDGRVFELIAAARERWG